jgi:hypothetical protein
MQTQIGRKRDVDPRHRAPPRLPKRGLDTARMALSSRWCRRDRLIRPIHSRVNRF